MASKHELETLAEALTNWNLLCHTTVEAKIRGCSEETLISSIEAAHRVMKSILPVLIKHIQGATTAPAASKGKGE